MSANTEGEGEAVKLMSRAAHIMHDLMMHDKHSKELAACLLTGYSTGNFAANFFKEHVARLLEKKIIVNAEGVSVDMIFAAMLALIEREAQNTTVEQLLHLLTNVVTPKVQQALAAHKKEVKKHGEQAKRFNTPFSLLQADKLKGPLRSGQVLVFQGTAGATDEAVRQLLVKLTKEKVKVTRLESAGSTNGKETGINSIPASWWAGCGGSLDRLNDVFSDATVSDGQVVLVEDLMLIGAGSGREDSDANLVKRILRHLRKMAKRLRRPIVCKLVRENECDMIALGKANEEVVSARVATRIDAEGNSVLLINGNVEVDRAGDENSIGSSSEGDGELAGAGGATEDGKPQGSGEDQGEAESVGG